jgi:YbbR domain-containing protein
MVNPSTVTVIIYQKQSKTATLSVDLINQDNLDQTLTISDISYDNDKVVIKGAEHQLNEVASVKAILDIDELSEQKSGDVTVKDVPLKAYNKAGDVVDVEIVPSKIDVNLKISSPSKEVPIKVIPEGEVSFGKAISSISQSETKVTIYGDEEELENITYIPVNVDVTDLKENKEYKLELSKPVGARSLSINNITVKITLDSVSNKDFEDIDIESKNLADGYSVQGVDENSTKVTVTVKGVDSVINSINASDISAYIDLSGYTEGEYEVPVNVEGIEVKASYVSKTKKVKIKIVKD